MLRIAVPKGLESIAPNDVFDVAGSTNFFKILHCFSGFFLVLEKEESNIVRLMIYSVVNYYQYKKMKRGYLLLEHLTHSLPIDGDFGTVFYYKGIDWFPQSWVNWCLTVLGGDYQKSFFIEVHILEFLDNLAQRLIDKVQGFEEFRGEWETGEILIALGLLAHVNCRKKKDSSAWFHAGANGLEK